MMKNKNICVHHIVPRSLGGTDDESNLEYITFEEHANRHDPNHPSFCGVKVVKNSILWRNGTGLTCRATIYKYKNEIIECLEKRLNTDEIIETLSLEFAKSTVDHAIQWFQKEYNLNYDRKSIASSDRKFSKETRRKMSEAQSGEKHPYAKLTWSRVYDIRWLLKNTSYTQKEIATQYKVSQEMISYINTNANWKEPTIWWK